MKFLAILTLIISLQVNADENKPALVSISTSASTYQPEAIIDFNLKATDDSSGVKRFSAIIKHKNGPFQFLISWLNETEGLLTTDYTYSHEMDRFAPPGQYKATTIIIEDYAGNYQMINNLNQTLFTLENSLAATDKEAPQFISIEAITSTILPGETASIRVVASDNLSGIDRVNVLVKNVTSSFPLFFEWELPSANTPITSLDLTLESTVVDYAQTGEYVVKEIYISDAARNETKLTNLNIPIFSVTEAK